MTSSLFGLRPIAYGYCQFVLQHFKFIGIDKFQIGLSLVFLAALCGLAFLMHGRARAVVSRLCPPWLYCLLLIFTLLIIRLPTFLPGSLNPDESVFLAGAMKLRHHPVFWEAVDGATSGPLNFYPLTLLNMLGLPFDYATARLLNVICIGATIAVAYRIARLFMDEWAARLTPLPALAAVMAFRTEDFIHYSSECVSVLLIAVATWMLVAEESDTRASWLRAAGVGALVALIPLAKLQASPIAAIIALGGIAPAFFRRKEYKWRRALYIALGVAAVMMSLFFFLLVFGLFRTFQLSYIANNVLYANVVAPMSLDSFFRFCAYSDMRWYEGGILASLLYLFVTSYYLWMRRKGNRETSNQLLRTAGIATLLYGAGAWWLSATRGIEWPQVFLAILIGFAAGWIRRVIQYPAALERLSFYDLFAFSILTASLYAVYRPSRLFPHYLVFLIFPLAFAGVRIFARLLPAKQPAIPSAGSKTPGRGKAVTVRSKPNAVRPAIVFVLLALAVPWFMRSKSLKTVLPSEAWMTSRQAFPDCAACQLVSHFAKPGDAVTVWGWAPEFHVLTGTIPATRDPGTYWQLIPSPLRDYYRSRFLEDLRRDPPKLFVDAVAPGRFFYQNRDTDGYETFPDLLSYVTSNFYLAGEIGGVRVFARKDLATR
jgi:hypothetical protein